MAIALNMRSLFPVAAIVLSLAVGARSVATGNVTNFTVNGNATSNIQVSSGLKLQFVCRLTFNVSAPNVYFKKIDATGRVWPISANEDFEDDSLTDVWSVVATDPSTLPNRTVEFTLTIPSPGPADSGNYTCVNSSTIKNTTKNFIQVDVIAEPTSAVMTFNGQQLTPGQPNSIQVVVGQMYSLSCNVSGGNPSPNVNISTSTNQLMPSQTTYNWTAMFTAINAGYIKRATNVTVNNVKFDVSTLGKPVTCTGGVKNPAAVSTSFVPISDAVVPSFQCADKVMYPKSVMDLVISCDVFAPNLNTSYVRWINSTKNNNTLYGDFTTMRPFVNDSRYTLKVASKPGQTYWYTMTLTVSHAHDIQDLSSITYQFAAANGKGQAVHSVTVQQDVAYVGGASQNVPSTVGYLLALLIAAVAAALMM